MELGKQFQLRQIKCSINYPNKELLNKDVNLFSNRNSFYRQLILHSARCCDLVFEIYINNKQNYDIYIIDDRLEPNVRTASLYHYLYNRDISVNIAVSTTMDLFRHLRENGTKCIAISFKSSVIDHDMLRSIVNWYNTYNPNKIDLDLFKICWDVDMANLPENYTFVHLPISN